eukprot:1395348-Amorphochlora_amoeboformis.AAC.1
MSAYLTRHATIIPRYLHASSRHINPKTRGREGATVTKTRFSGGGYGTRVTNTGIPKKRQEIRNRRVGRALDFVRRVGWHPSGTWVFYPAHTVDSDYEALNSFYNAP